MSKKFTSLYQEHVALKGRFVSFAGYQLPLWYTSHKNEHLAVRNKVGLFDISHMGILKITGKNAHDLLQYLSCNDISPCKKAGRVIYTMFLNENGGILEDLTIAKYQDSYYLIVNASNTSSILNWITLKAFSFKVTIEQLSGHSLLSIQGPSAFDILQEKFSMFLVNDLIPFHMKGGYYKNCELIVSRLGYTGEDGVELIVPNEVVVSLWNDLVELGITPCGLAARDSLRIEAGLPLYGQEISKDIHPLMTRYKNWIVKYNHDFIGKKFLESINLDSSPVTIGLKLIDSGAMMRTNYKIIEGGYVTSGTLSPLSNQSVAMAIVDDPNFSKEDMKLTVSIRGKAHCACVVSLPFYKRSD